jgi:hypothetical protein
MSFGLNPTYGAKSARAPSVSGLSIMATLISPVIAVLLTQYLQTHREHLTPFALPVQNIHASLAEDQSHPTPAVDAGLPRDRVQFGQAFPLKSEKQTLAKKLIAKSNGAKDDPASRFVMLRLAKDIATQANDGETAFQAIDAIAETSHVDVEAMKMAVLVKFASVAKTPAQHGTVAEQALTLVDQAVAQEHFMVANQLGRLALAEAKRSTDRELVAQVQGRIAEVAARVKAREIALSRPLASSVVHPSSQDRRSSVVSSHGLPLMSTANGLILLRND